MPWRSQEPQLRAEISRASVGKTLTEANAEARRIMLERFPHAEKSTLPEWVLELNPLIADKHYISGLSQDIQARIFGDAARQLERLGKMVPSMFGKAPRAQEYEWDMGKGLLKALAKKGDPLEEAVLRNRRADARLLDSLHRHADRISGDAGQFNLSVGQLGRR